MTGDDVIVAMALPAVTRIDRRVPKTLLAEHGAPTAADKRAMTEDIESLQWVAALKPGTIGVPAFRDDERTYEEIAVMRLTLRHKARAERLMALVHRAIPYPVALVTETDARIVVSVAHIRRSHAETGKTVLADHLVSAAWEWDAPDPVPHEFRAALALSTLSTTSLLSLYQAWMDVVISFQAWRVTGTFVLPSSPVQAEARRQALATLAQVDAEVARLRTEAGCTTQTARKADINVTLKRLREARAAAEANL